MLTSSPYFGILLTVLAYSAAVYLNKKVNNSLVNPIIVSAIFIIAVLSVFHIPLEHYKIGSDAVSLLMIPATVSLALPTYKNLHILKKHLLPVLCGVAVGAVVSVVCVFTLCRLFGLDEALTASLLPKSTTMPFALDLSRAQGGIDAITIAAVVFTGVGGAMVAPLLLKLFGLKGDIEAGVAIGTSSHIAGTSKATEINGLMGAVSGISVGLAGIFTVIFMAFW